MYHWIMPVLQGEECDAMACLTEVGRSVAGLPISPRFPGKILCFLHKVLHCAESYVFTHSAIAM